MVLLLYKLWISFSTRWNYKHKFEYCKNCDGNENERYLKNVASDCDIDDKVDENNGNDRRGTWGGGVWLCCLRSGGKTDRAPTVIESLWLPAALHIPPQPLLNPNLIPNITPKTYSLPSEPTSHIHSTSSLGPHLPIRNMLLKLAIWNAHNSSFIIISWFFLQYYWKQTQMKSQKFWAKLI